MIQTKHIWECFKRDSRLKQQHKTFDKMFHQITLPKMRCSIEAEFTE